MADRPKVIYVDSAFMAAYEAERTRGEWLAAGASWRRAKREARKSLNRSWRQAAVDRLDGLANPAFSGIDRTPIKWWKNG